MIDFKGYTHDLMVAAIQNMLGPSLVHGQNFWVAHPISRTTGEQSGDPFIAQWTSELQQPSDAEIVKHFRDNEYELRAVRIRLLRDEALSSSDGRADLPGDAPESAKEKAAAWAEYRTALRDIPIQPGFPFSIEWPALPK
ncbi:phage tail assembly chaperone [Paraburkholderia sediminicola]|uniref:XkdW family protein n=1 Tax=Paraburkholderia sediminicola TaxID=458836 RepID=UPI0038B8DCA8